MSARVAKCLQRGVKLERQLTAAAEVHSSSRRAKGVAITTCTNWFFNFVVGLITPPMIQSTGFGTFIFFGIWAVLALIWAIFVPPETK